MSSAPGARRLFVASMVARLPLAMVSIGLLVHTRQVTGSFAQAGVVAGAFAIGLGVGGPLLGQLIDRRGPRLTLLASASVASASLLTIGLLPSGAPFAALVALATAAGFAAPPVGACLRAQLPALMPNVSAVREAYALEASLVELTYIFGPPLALCLGALWSTGAALAIAGVVLLLAVVAFSAQPASHGWRPPGAGRLSLGGSLHTPTMRTLVVVLVAVGILLGADEVAVIAAAKALQSPGGAAPLFAVWGAGSFIGGLLFTRLAGGRRRGGLALLLAALAVGHVALIPAHRNTVALGVVLLIAGAAIAPTEATLYAMVDDAVPDGAITEAFAWLATAMAVGNAAGAAGGGLVADRAGAAGAFALGGGAAALALMTSMLRSGSVRLPHTATGAPHPARCHRRGRLLIPNRKPRCATSPAMRPATMPIDVDPVLSTVAMGAVNGASRPRKSLTADLMHHSDARSYAGPVAVDVPSVLDATDPVPK